MKSTVSKLAKRRLQPLREWICDTCNQLIKKPEDGYVEWVSNDMEQAEGFRIIHGMGASPVPNEPYCSKYEDHPSKSDLPLEEFLGDKGNLLLISLIDPGPYHAPRLPRPFVADFRQWTELFKRLRIPYYEEARFGWKKANAHFKNNGENEISIYSKETLEEVIERFVSPLS